MRAPAPQRTAVKAESASVLNSARSRLLQRKCACGGAPGFTGECEECSRKRLSSPRTPAAVQTKLTVNRLGDEFEQEADRVAEAVVSGDRVAVGKAIPPPAVQRQRVDEKKPKQPAQSPSEEQEPFLQPMFRMEAVPDPQAIEAGLRSPGHPLDAATREFMESRFGHGFGQVRVHTDVKAAESAARVNALAFTVGRDVVFGAAQYVPATATGRLLLAHELTHVLQQSSSPMPPVNRCPEQRVSASEIEDESTTQRISANYPVAVTPRSETGLQRYGHDVQSCKEEDVRNVLWPGDYLARQWLAEAINELNANPSPAYLPRLLKCYFMTETPDLGQIRNNMGVIQARFQANDYFYTCLEDCDSSATRSTYGKTKVSTLWGGSGPIVLCMNVLRKQMKSEWTGASTIIHEFAHRYLNFTGDIYCSGCCEGLSEKDALKNPDSYSGFVWDLHFAKFKAGAKEKKK